MSPESCHLVRPVSMPDRHPPPAPVPSPTPTQVLILCPCELSQPFLLSYSTARLIFMILICCSQVVCDFCIMLSFLCWHYIRSPYCVPNIAHVAELGIQALTAQLDFPDFSHHAHFLLTLSRLPSGLTHPSMFVCACYGSIYLAGSIFCWKNPIILEAHL